MKKVISVLVLGCCSLPTWAEGFYVAGDLGRSKWNNVFEDGTSSSSALSIAAGYEFRLPFQDTLAIELGYADLGGGSEDLYLGQMKLDFAATQLSAIAGHAFDDKFNLYGRLGCADLEVKARLSGESAADSKAKLYGGVGGRYVLTEKLRLRVELDWYDSGAKLSIMLMGVELHF
jgi:hypothetical protein